MYIEHPAMRRTYAQKQKRAPSLNASRLFIVVLLLRARQSQYFCTISVQLNTVT